MTDGASLIEFCQQVVEHLRGVMVLQMTGDATLLDDLPGEAVQQLQQQAQQLDLAARSTRSSASARRSRAEGGYQPQLPLEMALVRRPSAGGSSTRAAPCISRVGDVAQRPPVPCRRCVRRSPAPTDGWREHFSIRREAAFGGRRRRRRAPPAGPLEGIPQRRQAAVRANIVAALNAVRDIAVTEHEVAFAFGNNEFSRNLVAKPDVMPRLVELLARYLGRP